jgi:hypothetical protein
MNNLGMGILFLLFFGGQTLVLCWMLWNDYWYSKRTKTALWAVRNREEAEEPQDHTPSSGSSCS